MKLRNPIIELFLYLGIMLCLGMCQSAHGQSFVKKYKLFVDSVIYAGQDGADSAQHWYTVESKIYGVKNKIYGKVKHCWEFSPNDIPSMPNVDRLFNGYRICTECYRKEAIHDTIWYERKKSNYELLDEKVQELIEGKGR